MKKSCLCFILSLICIQYSLSQVIFNTNSNLLPKDKYQFPCSTNTGFTKPSLMQPMNKQDADLNTAVYLFILIINPELIYENEKVNFGLTKEVSFAFPLLGANNLTALGRVGLEYSFIFRNERNHHLRSSLNLDIPIESSEFVAVTVGAGGGYFTDFKKNGIFPQIYLGMLIPTSNYFAVNPYIKLRHTFMLDKSQSDNTDISVGVGLTLFTMF
jgi:hypothetical protein